MYLEPSQLLLCTFSWDTLPNTTAASQVVQPKPQASRDKAGTSPEMQKPRWGSEKPHVPAQPCFSTASAEGESLGGLQPLGSTSTPFPIPLDFSAKSSLCAKLAVNLTFLTRGEEGTGKTYSWVTPCTSGFTPQSPQERGFALGSAFTGGASPQVLAW